MRATSNRPGVILIGAMSIWKRILNAGEGKKVKALASLVPDINVLEPEIAALTDIYAAVLAAYFADQ